MIEGTEHMEHDHMDHNSASSAYVDILTYGVFHGTSSHTEGHDLAGGRTPITTEAMVAYNGLRAFFGLEAVDLETIGQWAFANDMTNNDQAWGDDYLGVGLYYGMQGAKVGWIRDDAFDPQILADIQSTARLGNPDDVMAMVSEHGHAGFAEYLEQHGLTEAFINTLKMEPHYGGWMHGRTHGDLPFDGENGSAVATAHDLNHLTVLSHDQTQPFMNDTFDWPQWGALEVPHQDVIDYFQSMVTLEDPRGDAIPSGALPDPITPPAVPEPEIDPSLNQVIGDALDNVLQGTDSADWINGAAGQDTLRAAAGDDQAYGGGGADIIRGGAGDDMVHGQEGDDVVLSGDRGNDTIHGGAGDDGLRGGADNDMLYGEEGNDRLIGDRGDDMLYGGAGDDLLIGHFGDDYLIGGDGFDRLIGGQGADVFKVEGSQGVELIADFEQGTDKIDLSFYEVGSVDQLNISAANAGGVKIDLTDQGGETVIVRDIEIGDLKADDFVI